MGRGGGRGGGDGPPAALLPAAGCCGCIWFITMILVGCAFDTLGPLESGIEINTFTKSIDTTRVYTMGRWYIGLGRAFLVFPRNYQTIEFSQSEDADEPPLHARSKNGQVTIDCSLQYSLPLTSIQTIYTSYSLAYHDKLLKIAQSEIKLEASEYEPNQFYEDRVKMGQAMLARLKTRFAVENVVVHNFQLRKVTLPAANEETIIKKLVAAERERTAVHEQKEQAVIAQSSVIAAQATQIIAEFQAEKQRNATILTQQATAEAKRVSLSSQTSVFGVLRRSLALSAEQLLQFLWLKQVRTLPSSATAAIGFKDAAIKVAP